MLSKDDSKHMELLLLWTYALTTKYIYDKSEPSAECACKWPEIRYTQLVEITTYSNNNDDDDEKVAETTEN